MACILIADDQPEILHALWLLLKQEGMQTVLAASPQAVLDQARAGAFDLILIDLNYTRDTSSGREGLDALAQLRSLPYAAPVIVMTAWSTVPLAVEAMRLGAADFIEKPWDNSKLLALVHRQLTRPAGSPPAGFTPSKDLEIARSVQNRLLPREQPQLGTLEYAVEYSPAGQVGGDYYDFIPLGAGEMAFVVADVSGKGISAAILMATIQSFFRSRRPDDFTDLSALVRSLNTLFFESSPAEHYATLFVLRYSDRTRSAEYINCGHTPPLLIRPGAGTVELDASGTVLGLFEQWNGPVESVTLAEQDSLLIFSDGLTEAAPDLDQDDQFGLDRLVEVWNRAAAAPLPRAVDQVARAIRAHSRGPLTDDLTILALRSKSTVSPHNFSPTSVSTMAPV